MQVEACGVGQTVLNAINGDLGRDPDLLPLVPGHEIVGRVIETGPAADESILGHRVVAYFYLTCGSCDECLAGRDPLCLNSGGFVGIHRDGGYAPYTVLPSRNLIPIPETLDPVPATVVPDAVATSVHVASRAPISDEDRVVVIGAGGGVGVHMIQVARLMGAEVMGLDITAGKLSMIESLGSSAVDSSDFSSLGSLFPAGPPTVIVDFLGSEEAATWSIQSLGPRGRLVVLTTFRDRPVPVSYRGFVFKEIELKGSRYATKSEVAYAADLIATGAVTPVVGQVVGPDEIPDLHHSLLSSDLIGRGALIWAT